MTHEGLQRRVHRTADTTSITATIFGNTTGDDGIERPWIREPGEYHFGNTVGLGSEWWTAEHAAREFNVAEREIRKRYRPLMPSGTVLPEMKELVHVYDFEEDGYQWEDYPLDTMEQGAFKNGREGWWRRNNRQVDHYARAQNRYLASDKNLFMSSPANDLEPMMSVTPEAYDTGYDKGLEPVSRLRVVVAPELYHAGILMEIRRKRVESRKVKPLPSRGGGGRFVKAS